MSTLGNVPAEEDEAKWFIPVDKKAVGPLKLSEILHRVERGELNWMSYLWAKGLKDWTRMCDLPELKKYVPLSEKPAEPSLLLVNAERTPPEPREWYLYVQQAQQGPFSKTEINRMITQEQIQATAHVWRQGMKEWQTLIEEGSFALPKAPTPPAPPGPVQLEVSKGHERRAYPRKPLVAKIVAANQETVMVGLCRDISVGGMQVLTDQVPSAVGSRIRLNVSPSSPDPSQRLDPFVAEGIVVRILEDQRGFSFRFEKLSDEARQAIEQYVHTGV